LTVALLSLASNQKEAIMSIQEVIDMSPELKVFAEHDKGYRQFCDQYSLVAADPKTRNDYVLWVNDQMREEGKREWIRQEIMEEVEQKHKGEILSIVRNMLRMNRPVDEIMEIVGMTREEVLSQK